MTLYGKYAVNEIVRHNKGGITRWQKCAEDVAKQHRMLCEQLAKYLVDEIGREVGEKRVRERKSREYPGVADRSLEVKEPEVN